MHVGAEMDAQTASLPSPALIAELAGQAADLAKPLGDGLAEGMARGEAGHLARTLWGVLDGCMALLRRYSTLGRAPRAAEGQWAGW